MRPTSSGLLLTLILITMGMLPFISRLRRSVPVGLQRLKGAQTVDDRVAELGPSVRGRLAPDFTRIGADYPPARLTLVGLKQERQLEVWVQGNGGEWKRLKVYPVLAASGGPGPKLQEGDLQVPEGMYKIESLNPNSLYHLSLRINYPNAFDRKQAVQEGRTNLGGDIMIHGNRVSIGCLAMGDEAAEDLFILAADTGLENISVILCPVDFRKRELPPGMNDIPTWQAELYMDIQKALKGLN